MHIWYIISIRLHAHEKLVPYLFTQWWLTWNTKSPDTFPLPKAFDTLSESDISDFLSQRALAHGISEAAILLWESSLKPVIELMLTLYHKQLRLKGWNVLQHPTPSAAFAHAYFSSIASYSNLSEKQKHKAQATIDCYDFK